MIKATKDLIIYLKNEEVDHFIVSAYVGVILTKGGAEDAKCILKYIKTVPDSPHTSELLEVIAKWGNYQMADDLYSLFISNDRLHNSEQTEVLYTLGSLKHPPIRPALIHYAFNTDNHSLNKSAVLGLLNFDCSDIQELILSEIEKTYGKYLFHEFTPALVGKLRNRSAVLEKLFELGSTTASTDCNAGIILGFSLCGKEGLNYFKKAIFSPDWEADSTSTGTARFTYLGLKNLNISIIDLFQEIQKSDNSQQSYQLKLLNTILELRVADNSNTLESCLSIYKNMFSWSHYNEENGLFKLADKHGMSDDLYRIQQLLELKLREELLIEE